MSGDVVNTFSDVPDVIVAPGAFGDVDFVLTVDEELTVDLLVVDLLVVDELIVDGLIVVDGLTVDGYIVDGFIGSEETTEFCGDWTLAVKGIC